MANLDRLIVLNLLELPKALDRIGDAAQRQRALDAVRGEIRAALDEGQRELDQAQSQLQMTEQNHKAAEEAVQKQELELIKLRQRDATAAELSEASRVLEPLKEALRRLAEQRNNLRDDIAPLKREVDALNLKLAQLNNVNTTANTSPGQTERKAAPPKSSETKTGETKTDTPKVPPRPTWPEGDYNPFSVLDYITGRITAEELTANLGEEELRAYLAQREIEKLEEEAEVARRLTELKKRLGKE